jgi:hypothetical protein
MPTLTDEPLIHQYIFAGPKQGLSAEAFQSYWVNLHAVDFAAKIPQIKRYLVATREQVDAPRQVDFFEGIAEIWLQNDADQIASMQTPEFLHGAREDEPRWAAFWQSFVLDTESTVLKEPTGHATEFVNAYVLLKRKPLTDLADFAAALQRHASQMVAADPTIRGCTIGLARKGLYGFGEPRFDAIGVWSFDTAAEAGTALASVQTWPFADDTCVFSMVAREHWIVGRPGARP